MSLRGLLVLIALLAGSVGALLWLKHAPSKPEAAPETPLLGSFTVATVREIVLRSGDATVALRQDAPSTWRMVQPVEAEADPRRVLEFVASLQDAKVRKTIADAAADLALFGLAPPACTVSIERDAGPPLVLRLGRASPVGSERYASVDGAKVVLTDGSLYGAVLRREDAFREKRLIPAEAETMTAIVLTRPDGRLALALSGAGCRLEAPFAEAASESACTNFARSLASLTLQGPFEAAPPADAKANRLIKIEVTVKGRPSPVRAFVAAAGVGGRRVAWREGATLVGLVDEAAAAELVRPAESFRAQR